MLTDDLLTYLFDGGSHLLFNSMEMWLASSRRFTSFVTTYQDKIRKKLRTTQDEKSLLDLQLELETAYLLHQEKSLSVVYEPELARRIRSPDFAVTFTTSLTFMVEVTRMQVDPNSSVEARFAETVPDKLGQLLSQRSNILLIGVEGMDLTADDIRTAMLGIQQRAERNDLTFLHGHGFRDRAEFFRQYQLLSEVLVRGARFEETRSLVTWINPQAKYPLPAKARTALYRSHTA